MKTEIEIADIVFKVGEVYTFGFFLGENKTKYTGKSKLIRIDDDERMHWAGVGDLKREEGEMTREEKIEEVMELAKKALDGQTKTIQMHLAMCYMAGCLAATMTSMSVMKLSKDEKRKMMIDSFDRICTGASKFFPEASEFIDKLQKNYLKEAERIMNDKKPR